MIMLDLYVVVFRRRVHFKVWYILWAAIPLLVVSLLRQGHLERPLVKDAQTGDRGYISPDLKRDNIGGVEGRTHNPVHQPVIPGVSTLETQHINHSGSPKQNNSSQTSTNVDVESAQSDTIDSKSQYEANQNAGEKGFSSSPEDKSPTAPQSQGAGDSESPGTDDHTIQGGRPGSCDRSSWQLEYWTMSESSGSFTRAGPDTYLYAAYYDDREQNKTFLRMPGLSDVNATIYCHIWWDNKWQQEPDVSKAEMLIHWHFQPVDYQNVLMQCKVNRQRPDPPRWVVFSDQRCGPVNAIMPIWDPRENAMEYNFTVCLHKALLFDYKNVTQFVEWMEVNMMFGAQRFIVYNYSTDDVLLPYMQHYIDTGVLEYLQWPVQDFKDHIPMYFGQGAVIDNCIYRAMYRTKYLLLVDVDEVIVPQRDHLSWGSLMADQHNPCRHSADALVKNAFFIHQQPHDSYYQGRPDLWPLRLDTLALTSRYNFTFPCPSRSKIILRPEETVTATVHYVVHLTRERWGEKCCIPTDFALMHHYRFWKTSVKDMWTNELNSPDSDTNPYQPEWDNLVPDRRLINFADEIVSRVTKVYKTLKLSPPS